MIFQFIPFDDSVFWIFSAFPNFREKSHFPEITGLDAGDRGWYSSLTIRETPR
jgi:hypothetical protein